MDAWEQWSALLIPHPNPHLFTRKKRLYQSSASASRSSSMSSLSDGTQKRRKLTKTCQSSSQPPEIEPLSFEHEPIADMTTNILDFFPLHDTSSANDCTTLDGLMSQTKDHAQNTGSPFPHAIITSVPQSISPTIVNSSSSFVALSMPQNVTNTATSELESDALFLDKCFFPNPLGYITRKLTKRRRTTRIPKSASTPLIPSEATPPINNAPSSSPTTHPDLAKLTNPSCTPPPISAAINGFHSLIGITDNPNLASSTVPPQHAPQSTFESSRFQAENGDPISIPLPLSNLANRIVHGFEISSACEANAELPCLPQEYTSRLDNSVLASNISAAITDVIPEPGLPAPEHISERSLSSKHFHPPGPSTSVEPLNLDERERHEEVTRRSSRYVIPITSGRRGDMDSEEKYNQHHIDRKSDSGTENLPLPTLNHSASALQPYPQSLHSNGPISVASSISTSPMITTSSSQGHGWSSSASSEHTQAPALSPSTSVGEEGIVGGNTTGVVMGAQELPIGAGSKPGLMSLAKWKWKSIRSKSEEEAVANKSDPGVNHVEVRLSTSRVGGDILSGCMSRSSEVNCETPQLIPSTPTDNSSVTITQATVSIPLLGVPILRPEKDSTCAVESVAFATTDAEKDDKVHKPIKSKTKPKFIIGDLDDSAIEFPVNNTSTEVHEISNTATPPLRLGCRDATNGEESHCADRRWTLTNALTDEKITDAGLVKVLDRMRDDTIEQEDGGVGLFAVEKVILEGWGTPDAEGVNRSKDDMGNDPDEDSLRGHTTLCASPTKEYGSYPFQTEAPLSSSDAIDQGARPKTIKQHSRSRSTPSQAWIVAQRALLTCRELILTERHYIAQLSTLVQQHTATPPPPQMCNYAKDLLQACERVLKGMEKDPSARGVAKAFLEREEEVQGAYIRWCGVVGGWFSGGGYGRDSGASVGRPSLDLTEVGNRVRQLSVKRRNRVASKTDADKSTSPVTGLEGEDGSLKRTVSTWRKSMPALSFETPGLYGGGDRKREREEVGPPSARKPAVRELAILPTQRVMRYVLIYQELLSHTPPTSPSRIFVERAAHAAARIAEKCDLAQGNVAFIASSSLNSNGGGSRTRSRTGTQITPPKVPPLPVTLVATERLGYDTVPSSPTSIRSESSVDSPTQFFQSSSNTAFMASSRRLSVPFISIGWGKSNKQKIPAASESMQVHKAAGVSSITYPA